MSADSTGFRPRRREFDIRLNIHYDLPKDEWHKIEEVYRSMPGYFASQNVEDCYEWYGADDSERFISVSVEPSGFDFRARIEEDLWVGWLTVLCAKLTLALGREVRDAEM